MAGTLRFIGTNELIFGPTEVHFGPKGCTSRFRVQSISVPALVNYYNYIIQFGASGRFVGTDYGETREMEVEVPGLTSVSVGVLDELFFDQWELLSNETTKSIFTNPLLVGGSSPVLNYNSKVVIARLARDGGRIAAAVESCNSDIDAGNLTAPIPANGGTSGNRFQKPTTGAATQITLEVMKGHTEYETPTHVLRHTSYCSATATYNSARSNLMKIYTPAQLLTEVGTGWTYNLPPRLYSEIAAIPFQSAPTDEATYYTWGWLKKITRQPVLANFMVEISTEYELGLWSNLKFSLAT